MTTDTEFYRSVDLMFESYLGNTNGTANIPTILIQDIKKNEILTKINYSKILFDSELNIYKIEGDKISKVDNPDFKAVVVKKQ